MGGFAIGSTFFNFDWAAYSYSSRDIGADVGWATRGGAGPRAILTAGTGGLAPVTGGAGGPLTIGGPLPPGA